MKIAIVSTAFMRTPPEKYGGTERVVATLADGLVRLGHDVTLFATGDSVTLAKLDYLYDKPEWSWEKEGRHARYAFAKAANFDLVHNHSYGGLPLAQDCPVPTVSTLHSLSATYRQFKNNLYIAISQRQRFIFRELKKMRVIHHGLDLNDFPFQEESEDYLVWVGRFCPDKGVHHAIKVAQALDMPLKLIGIIGDSNYFNTQIKPHLNDQIQYLGEMGEERKQVVKRAKCFLMPIEWEEPFGLVMIEAMACGTPVVAFNRGSVLEVIEHGRTGFIVTSVDEMIKAVRNIGEINRLDCRNHVRENFSADRMVANHELVYQEMLEGKFR